MTAMYSGAQRLTILDPACPSALSPEPQMCSPGAFGSSTPPSQGQGQRWDTGLGFRVQGLVSLPSSSCITLEISACEALDPYPSFKLLLGRGNKSLLVGAVPKVVTGIP